jgi:hypothetical protein
MASLCLTVAGVFFLYAVYQRPQRPYWPPLGGLHCPLLAPRLPPLPPRLPPLPPRFPPLAPPRGGPPWCPDPRPDPRPLWDGGSWPESHSGVRGGTGLGGEVGGWPFAAFFFFAGAGAGTGTTPPPPTPSPPGECVPPPPRLWCGGRTHSLGGQGKGGHYFGRRRTLFCTLYICKYFVACLLPCQSR